MKNGFLFSLILFFLSTTGFSLTDGDRLIHAVEANDLASVQQLLQKGADVNFLTEDGKTPLICAVLRENKQMVSFLLNNGAVVDFCAPGTLSPRRVARLRNLNEIDSLLSAQDPKRPSGLETINLVDLIRDNRTADLISALSKNPKRANTSSAEGDTPLMHAAYWGKSVYVKTLLEFGADPNIKDHDGFTALHLAASKGHTRTVKLLLQNGAAADIATQSGLTPLMLAAKGGYEATARLLIAYGADWSKRSNANENFFDLAKKSFLR